MILKEILRFYGMPEQNIDLAITQIAQGYGACRYLEGVSAGAEATGQKLLAKLTIEEACKWLSENDSWSTPTQDMVEEMKKHLCTIIKD